MWFRSNSNRRRSHRWARASPARYAGRGSRRYTRKSISRSTFRSVRCSSRGCTRAWGLCTRDCRRGCTIIIMGPSSGRRSPGGPEAGGVTVPARVAAAAARTRVFPPAAALLDRFAAPRTVSLCILHYLYCLVSVTKATLSRRVHRVINGMMQRVVQSYTDLEAD